MTRLSASQGKKMKNLFRIKFFVFVSDENIQRECEIAQQIFRQSIENIERETEDKIRLLFFACFSLENIFSIQ
jgi:hypothetical protein